MTKILLIEDEPQILKMYERLFTAEGYAVVTASDGGDGLKKINQWHPNLILLDIMMPMINGLDVLQKVKENPATKDIPVIILTNLDAGKEMSAASLLGAAAFIIKSNNEPKDVVAKVKDVLKIS